MKTILIAAAAFTLPLCAFGAEASLEEVWAEISGSSKAIEASRYELDAADAASDRAGRHWLPRAYLDARGYQTNDPGQIFFGYLSQRSVNAADFNPSTLNRPESRLFVRGALGLDLPIYEGGSKTALVAAQKHNASARASQLEHTRATQYLEVAKAYSSLQTLARQRRGLRSLSESVDRILNRYQVGVRSNPVGYSGFLGLKTLRNRLEAALAENNAKAGSARLALREMGFRRQSWEPEAAPATSFAEKYLGARNGPSHGLAALRGSAQAAREMVRMEGARYLPRVGLFVEEALFHGNRATETSWAAGAYLQWNLFSPAESGMAHEARLKAAAAESGALAMEDRERAEAAGIDQALEATLVGLRLSEASETMLEEQTRIAEKLFRTGSIPALQLVEALSRRLDLIQQHADAEQTLVRLSAEKAQRAAFSAPGSEKK